MGRHALEFLGCGVEIVAKHRDHRAAFIGNERLEFGVDFLALGVVEKRTRFDQLLSNVSFFQCVSFCADVDWYAMVNIWSAVGRPPQ